MILDVKAMGLATSLGGLRTACAAYRAGMARAAPIPDFNAVDEETGEPVVVAGHAVGAATFGFSGTGRLAALLTEALVDLDSQTAPADFPADMAVIISLPAPDERGFSLLADPSEEDERPPERQREDLAHRILRIASQASGIALENRAIHVVIGGQTGFATALGQARVELQARRTSSVLICAVDSCVSGVTLDGLLSERRLKTPESPSGFSPGEAAVVALVEPGAGGRRGAQRASSLGVREISFGTEPEPRSTDASTDGRALTGCAIEALQGWSTKSPRPPVIISDHDGEEYRALELGMLLLSLKAHDSAFTGSSAWLPATGFGNTGAASGGLAVAIALRALARGYSPADNFLVLSSSDDRERAAIHLVARSVI